MSLLETYMKNMSLRELLKPLKQREEETLREFSTRVWQTAINDFPDTDDSVLDVFTYNTFIQGCLDQAAAFRVFKQNPDYTEALQYTWRRNVERHQKKTSKTNNH